MRKRTAGILQNDKTTRMICSSSKKLERVHFVEEGSAGWEQVIGSAYRSKLEELGEALCEAKPMIKHSSHQQTGP